MQKTKDVKNRKQITSNLCPGDFSRKSPSTALRGRLLQLRCRVGQQAVRLLCVEESSHSEERDDESTPCKSNSHWETTWKVKTLQKREKIIEIERDEESTPCKDGI